MRQLRAAGGSESEPTADEAELAAMLGVAYPDLLRALGAGLCREVGADERDGVARFVSGEPAQLAIGVQVPWFVLARPLTSEGEVRPSPLWGDGPRFTSDDVLHDPPGIAMVADDIASHRRRSFRWCRTCRRASAPESFVASQSACAQCVRLFADG
ncbi:hypothetical protein [Blastococcus saxobsidens]|uniref:hypothetical protein n=1 Tax=Blastococcus saxobsidens TaxID=138336 RepID=UPI001EF998B3|nr:hypothetical protein [Blastococcus saxobsidens]